MDIDKSLYMKDFLELRKTLGSVLNKPAEHVLFTNLYNAFLPRKIQTKVKDIVEEIEEKTILIKDNKQIKNDLTLFDDAPIQEDVGKLPMKEKEQDELPIDILIEESDVMDEEENKIADITEDVPEDITEDVTEDEIVDVTEDIKENKTDDTSLNEDSEKPPIKENEEVDIDLMGGGRQLKKIVINPNYVANDA